MKDLNITKYYRKIYLYKFKRINLPPLLLLLSLHILDYELLLFIQNGVIWKRIVCVQFMCYKMVLYEKDKWKSWHHIHILSYNWLNLYLTMDHIHEQQKNWSIPNAGEMHASCLYNAVVVGSMQQLRVNIYT